MYQAIGRAVRRNADNTFTVKVEILDDRESGAEKTAGVREWKVSTMTELRQKVKTELETLKAAEQDATLNAAVVGIVLGEI